MNGNNKDKYTFTLDWGLYALLRLISSYDFRTVLDIGSGAGEHKRFFEVFGKEVFSVDIASNADYCGDFLDINFDKKFDVVWCSHVLEHQRNVGIFMDKVFDVIADDGILAITVPIHPRERLVTGHISSWSIPLLCYNLIMAGFDCSDAKVFSLYELSVIVQKKKTTHRQLWTGTTRGADVQLEDIACYFPFPAQQGVDLPAQGNINWGNPTEYTLPMPDFSGPDGNINIKSKNLRDPRMVPVIQYRER